MFGLYWVSVSTALPAVTWVLPGNCSRSWRNTGAPTKMNYNFCSVVKCNYQTRQCDAGSGKRSECSEWTWRTWWLRMPACDRGLRAVALTLILFPAPAVLSFLGSPPQVRVPVVLSCHPRFSLSSFSLLLVRDEAVSSYLSVLSLLALC